MFSNQVRQRVRGLVAGIGPSIVSNPAQLEAKLADLAADNAEDVRLIVSAAHAGIPEEIASAPVEHRAELTEQAATWMAGETGASAEAAKWAVETWAAALEGVKIEPKPEPAPAPQPTVLTPPSLAQPSPAYGAGAQPAPWGAPPSPQPTAYSAGAPPAPWGAPPMQQTPAAWGAPPQAPGYGQQTLSAPRGAPAGAWPPPPGQQGRVWMNTSGLQGDVPSEIAKLKWNWGAFCLPFWWLRSHNLRQYSIAWAVLALVLRFIPGGLFIRIPLILAISVALGIMGHKLAWQNRTFDSVEHYFTVQRAWMAWGIPISVITWGAAAIVLALLGAGVYFLSHAPH